MYATLGVLATVIAAVLYVPLPHRVYCTLEIQPRDAKSIFVSVPGELEQVFVKPGEEIAAGAKLAELANLDVDLSLAELTGERDQNDTQLESLRRQMVHDPQGASLQIQPLEATLAALNKQINEKRIDLERLTLVSPVSGTVLPPPELPMRQNQDKQLPHWSGTPLDPENHDAYLEQGVLFCLVGDPHKMEALLVVDQEDIEYLKKGQLVDVKLDQLPAETLQGEIVEIAAEPLAVSPRHLSNKAGGELATKTDDSGVERPLNTSYQVRVPIDDPENLLRIGLRGRGRIHGRPQTLGHRLWRYITQTFNFRL